MNFLVQLCLRLELTFKASETHKLLIPPARTIFSQSFLNIGTNLEAQICL